MSAEILERVRGQCDVMFACNVSISSQDCIFAVATSMHILHFPIAA